MYNRQFSPQACIKHPVVYLRRSREDAEREVRTGEDTLAMQREVMERVLREYGLPYDLKVEIGSGDKIAARPIFQQVLRDLRSGLYDSIAVKDISRLTRGDFSDYGTVYDLICSRRIYILTPYRLYDPGNANDLRQIRFELFLSREEFEVIRERMQGAKYAYAMAGKFMGSTPALGYQFNPKTQHLEIASREAELVRRIFALYINGLGGKEMGYRAIATFLTRSGVPSPRGHARWNPTTVRKILQNPVYVGEIRYRTGSAHKSGPSVRAEDEQIIVTSAHEPIVSPEVFARAQAKARQSRKPATPFDRETSELSGLIRCGKCQRGLVKQAAKSSYQKKDGSISRYHKEMLWCTTVGCTYVSYRAVEEAIFGFLQQLPPLSPSELRKHLSAPDLAGGQATAEDELGMLLRQRSEWKKRLTFVYRNYESGTYSEPEFISRREEVCSQIRQIDQLISRLRQSVDPAAAEACGEPERSAKPVFLHELYQSQHTASAKNQLLRGLIESATLRVSAKGSGRKPSAFQLEIAFRLAGLFGDSL
ncbi:recombinase family protein [Brevibacillus sp. B_LB10_24]|uniref:recombinase family protein n=1 Tax=Brevibacillus sp. B_LB10_24 TaxID=3380645 RepID=UPI0038BA016B